MASPSLNIAKETRDTVGTSKTYSNRKDRKDKCSG